MGGVSKVLQVGEEVVVVVFVLRRVGFYWWVLGGSFWFLGFACLSRGGARFV